MVPLRGTTALSGSSYKMPRSRAMPAPRVGPAAGPHAGCSQLNERLTRARFAGSKAFGGLEQPDRMDQTGGFSWAVLSVRLWAIRNHSHLRSRCAPQKFLPPSPQSRHHISFRSAPPAHTRELSSGSPFLMFSAWRKSVDPSRHTTSYAVASATGPGGTSKVPIRHVNR